MSRDDESPLKELAWGEEVSSRLGSTREPGRLEQGCLEQKALGISQANEVFI